MQGQADQAKMSPVVVQPLHVLTLHHQLVMFRTWLGGAPGAFTKASLVQSSKDDTESWTYLKAKAQSLSESLRGFFYKSFGVLCHSMQNLFSQEAWGPLDASAPCQNTNSHHDIMCGICSIYRIWPTHKILLLLVGQQANMSPKQVNIIHQIRLDKYYRSDRF